MDKLRSFDDYNDVDKLQPSLMINELEKFEYELNNINSINEGIEYIEESINEGIISRVVGGLAGFALGKTIGKFLVRIFQIPDGTVLHKVFTSRLFYTAIGVALGKDSGKKINQSPK